MKRGPAMVIGLVLVLIVGCGTETYERRMQETLKQMKYQKKLDENLTEAVGKGKLEELQIYIRPPKAMSGPTQTFQMSVVDPGMFDVESSFIDGEKSMHVLARVKQPKPAAKKGAPQPDLPERGPFVNDVLELVNGSYGTEITTSQLKSETKGSNTFKTVPIDLNTKNVHVYLYENKTSNHDVAIIFEYPKAEQPVMNPKITLCLSAFAVGERAKLAFSGNSTEDEAGDLEGEGAAEPSVF